MATAKKTIRLLIIEDSQNEAERLVCLFRNAGSATRVQRLSDGEELKTALLQSWDLLIVSPNSRQLPVGAAIEAIRHHAKDIPIIQLLEDNESDSVTEALMLGVQDALPQGEDERLVLAANRELNNLDERRARRVAEAALREAEKRCQLLLESSVDAISYVHEGMHIYANRAYLELFRYEDVDELAGVPMIDLIANQDQNRIKDLMKNYHDAVDQGELEYTAVKADGEQLSARMQLSDATYDGEPCIQMVIRPAGSNTDFEEKLREISSLDSITGFYNRSHFLELLDNAAQRAVSAEQSASFAYIRIDQYATLLAEVGLGNIDALLTALAKMLREHFGPQVDLARFGDDVFAALQSGVNPEQALPSLEALLKIVDGHLFEIAGRTLQISFSIGVAGLNERTPKAQQVVDRAHRCADELSTGNAIKLFNPAAELAAAASRGNVAAMVQHALDNNSFRLLFQPVISLRGDRHEYYETLVRLVSPQGEEIPPADFMEAAKNAGLNERIDRWVVIQSMKRLSEQRAKGHNTCLFLHLTSGSLQDANFLPWFSSAMRASGLPSDALVLQISEPDAIAHLKQAKDLTQGAAAMQVKVSLSQFGCALNPFNALRHLHVDFVKIDGSYVQDLGNAENQASLKELMDTLSEQGKANIVPYVESASVMAILWQAGANYIQGYYLQGPSQTMDYDFSSEE